MRRPIFHMAAADALGMLAAAPSIHLAAVSPAGAPVLRVVNAVVVDQAVCFHGAPAGEKLDILGRPAVVSVEEEVARIPSHFLDEQRACPATTLYRSVQAHGVAQRVEDPDFKARVLQALMEKLQPEGGHVPITAEHPLYRSAVQGILVVAIPLARVDGKAKLMQNRPPQEVARVLEGLWRRGGPTDARAITRICAANPQAPTPAFLAAPAGITLHPWLGEDAVEPAVELLRGAYWNAAVPVESLRRAHRGASAWVGARQERGELIGTARALSDGGKFAYVFDVMVRADQRGRGVGQALMRLLLDHPAVRGAHRVWLRTRDAMSLYARFGFADASGVPRPAGSTDMVLWRRAPPLREDGCVDGAHAPVPHVTGA